MGVKGSPMCSSTGWSGGGTSSAAQSKLWLLRCCRLGYTEDHDSIHWQHPACDFLACMYRHFFLSCSILVMLHDSCNGKLHVG